MFPLHFAPEFLHVTRLQLVECFVIYSILGWLVESAYMSICEKKLTNRGFGFGPFCPIYGFGATIGAVVLSPFRASWPVLYVVSAVGATIFELFVGRLMQFFLGDFWWDYNEKPFNYDGIICLESTLGWGLYGVIVVNWLHPFTLFRTAMIPPLFGKVACFVILAAYMIDFIYHVLLALHIDVQRSIAERSMQAAAVAREKTSNAIHLVGEKKDLAIEMMQDKRDMALELMHDKRDLAIGIMQDKRDLALELVHDKKDAVTGKVREKRQAVLNWYREHRWR